MERRGEEDDRAWALQRLVYEGVLEEEVGDDGEDGEGGGGGGKRETVTGDWIIRE